MHHMYEELVRADLAERRAEAARLRMIPPRSRRPVLLRLRGCSRSSSAASSTTSNLPDNPYGYLSM